MPKDEFAWTLMQQNAERLNGKCVLCYIGVSGGTGQAEQCHHIKPKQMGGTIDPFVLSDNRNMAPACQKHHERYQPNRIIWVAAMTVALDFIYDETPLQGYQVPDPARYLQRFM